MTLQKKCYTEKYESSTLVGHGAWSREEMRWRLVSSKGIGRPRLSRHYRCWWNETKWMRWVWRNDGIKFVEGKPHFVHHETHMACPRRELGTPAAGGNKIVAMTYAPTHVYMYCLGAHTVHPVAMKLWEVVVNMSAVFFWKFKKFKNRTQCCPTVRYWWHFVQMLMKFCTLDQTL